MENVKGMTAEDVKFVTDYADLIDVKVTPVVIGPLLGVSYRDTQTFDYHRAMRDLMAMRNEICAGQGQAA